MVTIDGTDISGATIDGTEVQEITMDGDIVFTAGFDMPDSAIHHYPMSEGSGSTFEDVIGGFDGDVNTSSWSEDDEWEDGYAIYSEDGDPSARIPELGAKILEILDSPMSIAFTFEVESSENDFIMGNRTQGGTRFEGMFGRRVPVDHFGFNIRDEAASNETEAYYDESLSTGTKYRVVFNVDAPNPSNCEVWVNADEDTVISEDDGPDDFEVDEDEWEFFGRDTGVDTPGYVDNMIVFDELLSENEIQGDYNAQPWS